MSLIDEKKCIKRAAAGDQDAFETLVVTYQTPVFHLCMRMTGNQEDAADLTQESFLKAWKYLDRFQFESAFSTWLYRIVSNTCLDFLRSARRRPAISLVTTDDEGEEQMLDVADDAPTPEEQVFSGIRRAQLAEVMARLPEDQQQILALRAVQNLSYSEIARVLEVKEGTVKSRLARARENLRKKLLQSGNFFDMPSSNQQEGGGGRGL